MWCRSMGTQATGIDSKKLMTHINFIAETHKKARVRAGLVRQAGLLAAVSAEITLYGW